MFELLLSHFSAFEENQVALVDDVVLTLLFDSQPRISCRLRRIVLFENLLMWLYQIIGPHNNTVSVLVGGITLKITQAIYSVIRLLYQVSLHGYCRLRGETGQLFIREPVALP